MMGSVLSPSNQGFPKRNPSLQDAVIDTSHVQHHGPNINSHNPFNALYGGVGGASAITTNSVLFGKKPKKTTGDYLKGYLYYFNYYTENSRPIDRRIEEVYPQLILRHMKNPTGDGLDYGCGNGRLAQAMLERHYPVLAVEPYIEEGGIVPSVKPFFKTISPFDGHTVRKLPYDSKRFSWISMVTLAGFMPEKTFHKLLSEFNRVSREHAVLLVHFQPANLGYVAHMILSKKAWKIFSGRRVFKRDDSDTMTNLSHIPLYTPHHMKKVLKSAGYKTVESVPFLLRSSLKKNQQPDSYFKIRHELQEKYFQLALKPDPSLGNRLTRKVLNCLMFPFALGYTVVAVKQ